MVSAPLRAACRRFTEEVCGHAIICGCGTFLALWLIASVTLLPVGIGIYVGYDKHIGTILMSVGGVCLFITFVYAMAVKFLEYYREEVAKEAQANRPQARPATEATPAVVVPVAPDVRPTEPVVSPTIGVA